MVSTFSPLSGRQRVSLNESFLCAEMDFCTEFWVGQGAGDRSSGCHQSAGGGRIITHKSTVPKVLTLQD